MTVLYGLYVKASIQDERERESERESRGCCFCLRVYIHIGGEKSQNESVTFS